MEKYLEAQDEFKDFYFAFFIAVSAILSFIEGVIPKPFPGIRLGIANSISIIFIVYYKYKEAVFISISKVLIVSLFGGYLFSPTFFFGFFGSLVSVLAMIVLHAMLKERVSPIGISVLGAFFHISTQILVAYLILPSLGTGLLFLSGILFLTSLIAGIITGLFTIYLLKRL